MVSLNNNSKMTPLSDIAGVIFTVMFLSGFCVGILYCCCLEDDIEDSKFGVMFGFMIHSQHPTFTFVFSSSPVSITPVNSQNVVAATQNEVTEALVVEVRLKERCNLKVQFVSRNSFLVIELAFQPRKINDKRRR
jgi:hypothetical protein